MTQETDYSNLILLCLSFLIMAIVTKAFKNFSKKMSTDFHKLLIKRRQTRIIQTIDEFHACWPEFMESIRRFRAVSLDCQWNSSFYQINKVSLIQMAFPDGVCYLFRLNTLINYSNGGRCLPDALYNVMGDSTILKFGIGIISNARKLKIDYDMLVLACVDLRNLAIRSEEIGISKITVKELCHQWLYFSFNFDITEMEKTNWVVNTLKVKQVEFASLQSLVGILAVVEFLSRKLDKPAYEIYNFTYLVRNYCMSWLDKPYSRKPHGFKRIKTDIGATNERAVSVLPSSKNIVFLVTPKNELIGWCPLSVAEKYVTYQLSLPLSVSPQVVQLFFNPTCIPVHSGSIKPGSCTSCGVAKATIWRNVVPLEYRMTKEAYDTNDIVILCLKCHVKYSAAQDELKKQMALEFTAPFTQQDDIFHLLEAELSQVRFAARFIITTNGDYRNQIRRSTLAKTIYTYLGPLLSSSQSETLATLQPSSGEVKSTLDRLNSLQSQSSYNDYFEHNPTSNQMLCLPFPVLKAIANLPFIISTPNVSILPLYGQTKRTAKSQAAQEAETLSVAHGMKVVNVVMRIVGSLDDFRAMWRQHFVDYMTPHHLPQGWNFSITQHNRYAEMNFCAFQSIPPTTFRNEA